MTRKLDFLICGAQKSGTTAIYDYLKNHPDIFLPQTKELHIFDNESRDWSLKGINAIDQEINHFFLNAPKPSLKGEATPVSLYWQSAPERIWRYNPNMILISILRNPITRAYSHWNMEIQRGRDRQLFNPNLNHEEERCREALPHQHRVFSYLSRGFYSEQLRRLWRYFPRKQVLVLKQEELLFEPAQTMKKIYTHLNISSIAFKGKKTSHVRTYEKDMPKAIKNTLRELYEDEIFQLEKMLNWNCKDWVTE